MINEWFYQLTIWTLNGIKEFIILVDVNDYDEDFFKYFKENEDEILKLLRNQTELCNSADIHDCKQLNVEFIDVKNHRNFK